MNEIIKKSLIEILRVVLAALLAAVGIETTGCIASGDCSRAAFVTSQNGVK